MARLSPTRPIPGNERAAATRGDHPGDAAAAELHACCGARRRCAAPSSIRAATSRGSRPPPQQAGVTIEKILLTHGHIDHCGSAGMLAEELGVEIEGPHEADIYWIDRLAEDGAKYGDRRQAVRAVALAGGRRPGERRRADTSTSATAPATPPATSSSTIPNRSWRWSATCLFRGSVGRWDFPHGDQQQLISSITTRLWPMGDDTAFVPGHGPMSTFGHERATNPFVSDAALRLAPRQACARAPCAIGAAVRDDPAATCG